MDFDKKCLLILIIFIFSILSVTAYDDYVVSDQDFINGYTKDLFGGDKFIVTINSKTYNVQVLSVFSQQTGVGISGLSDSQTFQIGEEKKFEVTGDNYYDIYLKLNGVSDFNESTRLRSASFTIRKSNEEIPEGITLPDSCVKYYTCPDGTKIKQCELSGQGCLCKSVSLLCPKKEPEQCEKYYTCSNGSRIQYCFINEIKDAYGNVVGAGCGCKRNPEELCITPSSGGGGSGGSGSGKPNQSNFSSGGSENLINNTLICDGCKLKDKCVPFSYRTNNKYCDINNEFKEQKISEVNCNNNFECISNLCIDNKCVSGSLWQKILRFFRTLFNLN